MLWPAELSPFARELQLPPSKLWESMYPRESEVTVVCEDSSSRLQVAPIDHSDFKVSRPLTGQQSRYVMRPFQLPEHMNRVEGREPYETPEGLGALVVFVW